MKKINETTKDLAVRSAEILNEIIKDANSGIDRFTATRSEWSEIFREYKLPYRHITVKRLIDDNLLIKVDEKRNANNRMYDLYAFDIESISYIYLMLIHDVQREKGIKNNRKNSEKTTEERAKEIKTTAQSKSISEILRDSIVNPKTFSVSNITDADLVAELRKRGYEVTAEKVTVIKL